MYHLLTKIVYQFDYLYMGKVIKAVFVVAFFRIFQAI